MVELVGIESICSGATQTGIVSLEAALSELVSVSAMVLVGALHGEQCEQEYCERSVQFWNALE